MRTCGIHPCQMKLNVPRLTALLETHGYRFVRQDLPGDAEYVHCESKGPTYHWVTTMAQGKKSEYVSGSVEIAVTAAGPLVKGLCETEVICEIATIRERCLTLIEDDETSNAWEQRLVKSLPTKLASLEDRFKDVLLQRTANARSSALKYLDKLPNSAIQWYAALPATPEKEQARQISRGPACHSSEHRKLYELAIYTILSHGREIEGRAFDYGRLGLGVSLANFDRELMWRTVLVVDGIMLRENERK